MIKILNVSKCEATSPYLLGKFSAQIQTDFPWVFHQLKVWQKDNSIWVTYPSIQIDTEEGKKFMPMVYPLDNESKLIFRDEALKALKTFKEEQNENKKNLAWD